eukprot:gene40299-54496_t
MPWFCSLEAVAISPTRPSRWRICCWMVSKLFATSVLMWATLLAYFHEPLPWDSDEPLALPQIYLFGVWLSILVAIGVTSLYAPRFCLRHAALRRTQRHRALPSFACAGGGGDHRRHALRPGRISGRR